MPRRVKDFIDIADHESLDVLIERLQQVRDSLPADAEAELRLRGDDVFGHRLTICYLRDQTAEEAECEARYADSAREARQRELQRLEQELAGVRSVPGKGKLRAVA